MHVRCRGDTEWTPGFVVLSSPNHKSVAIMINGAVRAGDGYVSVLLPLIYEPDTDRFIGVVSPDDEYEIEMIRPSRT